MLPADKPEDDIIEDDFLLDKWYKSFTENAARQAAKQRAVRSQ